MQKPSKEILVSRAGSSFLVRTFGRSGFDAPYHFHPEYELTYIVKGKGKRFVGNNMSDFAEGDLVLLGSKLPHCWKLESKEDTSAKGSAVVVQFAYDCMGEVFFEKPEFSSIRTMLERSKSGISFNESVQRAVKEKLMSLSKEKDSFTAFTLFLQILHELSRTRKYRLADKQHTIADWNDKEQERINAVYAYIVENFKEDISLHDVAGVAHMSPNAFCKYFKKLTRKTLMETVIDYRIGYAMQLLVNTDKQISEISFESGFGDVSHFYKIFRSRMKISPLQYRRKFNGDLAQD